MFPSSNPAPLNTRQVRWIGFLLRVCGVIDLLALFVVVMPDPWIASLHALLKMGPFPNDTIALYLARSSSMMYAAHGLLLLFVSLDVNRFQSLIHFLALIAIIHGLFLIGIDYFAAMPWWWTAGEGLLLITWGCLVFVIIQMRGTEPASNSN